MNGTPQAAAPRRVTVIPADPQMARQDIRKKHLRVAPYCRVSTDKEEQLSSYEAQIEYYTDKINSNPDWTMVRLYADEGITGTSAKKRKDFLKMVRDCQRGKIDLVITKSVSRFCRNTLDGLNYVRRLKGYGVGVYFEKENVNTLYMDNEMILTFMMSQAQAESESLSGNVKWGHRKNFQDGKVYYNYKGFLGYRKGPDGQPEIDPEQAAVVRRIFSRYLLGHSVRQIVTDLMADGIKTATGKEVWHDSVVQKMLRNEKYIGDAILQKTYIADLFTKEKRLNNGVLPKYYIHDCHPAIIDRDTFQKVQEEMARRSSLRKTSSKTKTELGKYCGKYVLSELLVCGECGTPYKRVTWARNGKKRIVWRCISRLEFGTKYCHNSPTLDEEKLHQAIQEAINEFAQAGTEVKEDMLTFTAMAWGGDTVGGVSLIDLRQKLKDITAQQALLLDQVLEHMDDEVLNAQLKVMMDEKQALQEQIAAAEQSQTHNAAQKSRMAELREWMAKLEVNQQYSDEQVRMAVERITVVDAETIRIRFRYPGTELEKKL